MKWWILSLCLAGEYLVTHSSGAFLLPYQKIPHSRRQSQDEGLHYLDQSHRVQKIRVGNQDASTSTILRSTADVPDKGDTKVVVVVGGGVGGLAVASRIASEATRSRQQNVKVILLEKNAEDMVGGRCGSFDVAVPNVGTFRHERGPSLLLLPEVYRGLFEDCGKDSAMFGLQMDQCVPAYQVVFDDGDSIDLGFPKSKSNNPKLQELEKSSRIKMNTWDAPNGAEKWDDYMRTMSAFLDCGLPNFIEERIDLLSLPSFLIEALRDYGKSWPLKPHSDVLDAAFNSNKMKALASFQDLYVGLEPYRNNQQLGGGVLKKTAPAVFGLLAALELHPTNKKAGVFAPIGGFRAVGNSFRRLAESFGVEIRFDTTVTQVAKEGVRIKGENGGESSFVPADLVVVNADLPFATKSLVSKSSESGAIHETFDWDDQFDFSSGVVAFHWAVNKPLDDLNTHNVFMSAGSKSESEQSWSILRDANSSDVTGGDAPFNFYVHRASKTDPSAAPEGCDSIMVLVPCKHLSRQAEFSRLPREEAISKYKAQFDNDFLCSMKKDVLKRLSVLKGLGNLESNIIHEVIDTPGTYADFYNVGAGVPFGLSHGFGQLSLTRPQAQSKELENVLYVGASSRPGNGVPLVLIGAKLVAEKAIYKLFKRDESD